MKVNKTYRSLLDKSISSMLSAIEIYNKPDFKYREETFAILTINAWELLFKAHLLKLNNYKMKSIYVMVPKKKKNGEKSKIIEPRLNRSKNPMTIGLIECIFKLREKKQSLSLNLVKSLVTLTELRDNAIHFHNGNEISKELQELGFACIKNYMNLIKEWDLKIDLAQYNFYLMPLAYVDSKIESESILTEEVNNYLNFLKKKVSETDGSDENFDVAIGIDISFKKAATLDGLGMRYDKEGVPIKISEEDMTKRFPVDYKEITKKAKERYSDYKLNKDFHAIMKGIKANDKLCHKRQLDPSNPQSSSKIFYSSNVWKALDEKYNKK
ncbi:MAG: DUF3644 domain-containing protein [Fluviicola sp.]|nr:DUF3644 domain-containing protein [Fluviicola sp.]